MADVIYGRNEVIGTLIFRLRPGGYFKSSDTWKSYFDQDRFYYVGGEVKSPNRYVWAGEITLTKAIQTASDFTDWANKKKVTITRAEGKSVGPINCVRVLDGKLADPPVYPGDKIFVRRRGF